MLRFFRAYWQPLLIGSIAAVLLVGAVGGKRIIRYTAIFLLNPPEAEAAIAAGSEVQVFDIRLWSLNAAEPQNFQGTEFVISGWADVPEGIRTISARFAQAALETKRAAHETQFVDGRALTRFRLDLALPESFVSLDRQIIEITALTHDGREKLIGRRSWLPDAPIASDVSSRSFRFLMMSSGVAFGGGAELDSQYEDYRFPHLGTGLSVPVLYMRTTKGADQDYVFDPDFDLTRQCDGRTLADDNLENIIAFAVEKKVPVQFILNGGIWSDAGCDFSEWDLTDDLEKDVDNCQWTQDDIVYPDDYLKNLPGSVSSSRLARSLTYHVHAQEARAYKKRNLQQAARRIAEFARQHPKLFIGITLDSDTYMNPFFGTQAFFDYNPGMLRQFREWLQGTGPYLGARDGVPDLSRYRRSKIFSLEEINAIAGQQWRSWEEVESIRPDRASMSRDFHHDPLWRNPWWQLWDTFRKHIIQLHYSELSQWAAEAGISENKIFTAQGFAGSVSINVDDRPFYDTFDSAGVSVEGGKPGSRAHLGAIVYGLPARNEVTLKNGRSLFSELARHDEGWAVVEYNPVEIGDRRAPQYRDAYQAFREMFNFDAQQVALMAWNGSNGLFAGIPEYVGYTSFRNTATEEAMLDFMIAHHFFPESVRLWTFGSAQHVSDDGWRATTGTLTAEAGMLHLAPSQNRLTLESPDDQVFRAHRLNTLSLVVPEAQQYAFTRIEVITKQEASWTLIAEITAPTSVRLADGFVRIDVPLNWPEAWVRQLKIAEQLRINVITLPDHNHITLHRISIAGDAP